MNMTVGLDAKFHLVLGLNNRNTLKRDKNLHFKDILQDLGQLLGVTLKEVDLFNMHH